MVILIYKKANFNSLLNFVYLKCLEINLSNQIRHIIIGQRKQRKQKTYFHQTLKTDLFNQPDDKQIFSI